LHCYVKSISFWDQTGLIWDPVAYKRVTYQKHVCILLYYDADCVLTLTWINLLQIVAVYAFNYVALFFFLSSNACGAMTWNMHSNSRSHLFCFILFLKTCYILSLESDRERLVLFITIYCDYSTCSIRYFIEAAVIMTTMHIWSCFVNHQIINTKWKWF